MKKQIKHIERKISKAAYTISESAIYNWIKVEVQQ